MGVGRALVKVGRIKAKLVRVGRIDARGVRIGREDQIKAEEGG